MKQHLTTQLKMAFEPSYLEVINESHDHSGGSTESHFKIIVVSDKFIGLKLIERHRQINELFKEELIHIHALAMHTYTLEEWNKKNHKFPKSPECQG
ncbi:Cell division protein BolA [hydrothermal vent metagenome]|uniref:Cell division protein BolA n=1 Tax=hydrothermal vent metagenome TaxID=652676 RepID=A0A1W1CC85_9ZZZZ